MNELAWGMLAYGLLSVAGVAILAGMALHWRRGALGWDVRLAWLNQRPWTWEQAGWMCLVLLLIQLGVLLARRWTAARMGPLAAGLEVWVEGATLHAPTLLLIAWMARRRRADERTFAPPPCHVGQAVGWGVWLYVATVPAILAAALVSESVLSALGVPLVLQPVASVFLETRTPVLRWLLVGLAVGVAPLAEEALFRGVLLPLMTRTLGARVGIALNALLFALIHFHLPSLLPLFVLALALALAYIYTRSLIVPVVMHALFNGTTLILLELLT